MPRYKSVKLRKETYERLEELKHPGQSFDGIVQELCSQVEKKVKGK